MSTKQGRYGNPANRKAADAAHRFVDARAAVNPDGVNIMACRPVKLPPDLQLPPDVDAGPMQDDTLRECSRCGQGVWVSPIKLELADAGKAVIMCMACAVTVCGPSAPVVDLNPGRDERPRK